jgi:hypothetical protein
MKIKAKTMVLAIALLALCVFMFGCNKHTDSGARNLKVASSANSTEQQVLVDKTAEPEGSYGVPPHSKKIMQTTSFADNATNPDIENISALSEVVVRGVTKKVSYVGMQGLARTISTVLVTEVYKGNLEKGDLISIYQLGGYIPLAEQIEANHDEFRYENMSKDEIENTIVKEVVDGEEFPEKGEDCLYFLVECKNSVYPAGSYARIAGQDAKLDVDKDTREICFERESTELTSGDDQPERFSVDDIKEAIKKDECMESDAWIKEYYE